MKFHIQVTKEDVQEAARIRTEFLKAREGSYCRSSSCPVAVAVKRTLGVQTDSPYRVDVTGRILQICLIKYGCWLSGEDIRWPLPESVSDFIARADEWKEPSEWKNVGTTEFILDWPWEEVTA